MQNICQVSKYIKMLEISDKMYFNVDTERKYELCC